MKFLIFILLFPFAANASAWLEEKGRVNLIQNFEYVVSDEFIDRDGKKIPTDKFEKLEIKSNFEYGYDDNLTFEFSPVYQILAQSNNSNKNLAYTDLYFRNLLWKNENQIISWQPLIKIPGFYDADKLPSLGPKQSDLEIRILHGISFLFLNLESFLNNEIAYRHRLNAPGDEIRTEHTYGIKHGNIMGLLQILNIFALDDSLLSQFYVVNGSDFNQTSLRASLVYNINEKIAWQVGGFSNIYTRNSGVAEGIFLSFWVKF